MKFRVVCVLFGFFLFILPMAAQTASSDAGSSAAVQLPSLVNFSGVLADVNGKPLTGVVGVTFSLYKDQQGGSPLWLETQNVHPSKTGNYTVALGASSSQGLPAGVFAGGEARWLGVRPEGQEEQPRVMLVSVPYALKAVDAETLGGRPASAFLAATGNSASTPAANVTGSGTKDFIPRWNSTSQIGNSNIFENGSGQVGIATTTPAARLDVNGATDIRNTLTLFPTGSTPTLKVSGSTFAINSAGKVTFISGQTFPGTGTITGVKAGSGLTGGGTSGTVTLSMINTCSNGQILQWNGTKWVCSNAGTGTITGVTAQAPITGGGSGGNVKVGLTNACSNGQVLRWNGSAWACATVGGGTITGVTAGTDLTGGGTSGTVTLNLDTAKVPQLAASNTFTGSEQIFNNSVIVGPITSFTEGQLAAGASSANNPGLGAVGFTVAAGSGQSGGDSIVSFGGSGDFQTNNGNIGGRGMFTEGGGGSAGGAGIFALGGSATEGGCCTDGPGGFFEGGSNNFSGDGIDAETGGGWAGNFLGSINVTGTLFAGTKDFKIDHPLDPANKYLLHASVESSEMMNIYTGNVTTDGQGEAVVHLPDWFEVLNTDFRYQLTVIGQFAQAIVGREIQNGEFAIRTNVPNVKVSWQITAVRHDAYAKANPLVVEQQKEARLRGFYIHPELYGAAPEKQIEWARHPELMRQAKERKGPSHPVVKPAAVAKSVQPAK
jgi:trimeric autotransporter adhesin